MGMFPLCKHLRLNSFRKKINSEVLVASILPDLQLPINDIQFNCFP